MLKSNNERQSYKIGLLGLIMTSGNLGCQALSYGFVCILSQIANKERMFFDLYCFEDNNIDSVKEIFSSDRMTFHICYVPSIRSVGAFDKLQRRYKECDVVFDFTSGDSFSDIYGLERFISRSIRKQMVLRTRTPLVLGSQTYGPFINIITRLFASHIIKHSYAVVSRDSISCDRVLKLCGVEPIRTIDVACMLPYKREKGKETKRFRIGFNPSGLLWEGYMRREAVSFDYEELCVKLIDYFLNLENVDVFLVPHVIDANSDRGDNDLVSCRRLIKRFPKLNGYPIFENVLEAKNYIANLDMFIGSRMHATIGAISSGVPTIPVSYSVKFKGVFEDLGYNHTVEIARRSTDEVYNDIISRFDNYTILCEDAKKALEKIEKEKEMLLEKYSDIISSVLLCEDTEKNDND